MKKYVVLCNGVEIQYKERDRIANGVSLEQDSFDPEVIGKFDTMEEALAELGKHKSTIQELSGSIGTYYLVEEYYVEEWVLDDDEEIVSGYLEPIQFSPLSISLIEKPSYNTIITSDNMVDILEAEKQYKGEQDLFISFN